MYFVYTRDCSHIKFACVFPFDVVLDQVSPGTSDPISFVAGGSAKTDFAQVVKRLFVRP